MNNNPEGDSIMRLAKKMKWHVSNLSAVLLCLLGVSLELKSQELLKNPMFKSDPATGKIVDWNLIRRPPDAQSSELVPDGGNVTLKVMKPDSQIFLIQNISLVKGKKYRISFEAKGTPGTPVRGYVEWVRTGNKYSGAATPKDIVAESDWKKYEFSFTADSDIDEKKAPYLGFVLRVPGEFTVRNPSLSEDKVSEQIQHGQFETSGAWQLEKSGSIEKNGGDGNSGMLVLKGPGALASQRGIELKGGTYRLSYLVMGRENRKSINGFSQFNVTLRTPSGKSIAGSLKQDCFNEAWQRKTLDFSVQGETTAELVCESFSDGLICLDNFKLEKIDPALLKHFRITLDSPYYRNMIFSSDPVAKISGTVNVNDDVKEIRIGLGRKSNLKPAPVENGKSKFEISAGNLKIGRHALNIEATLKDGRNISETIIIEKLPPAKNEIIIKNDNNLYVNNKVYFFQRTSEIALFGEHEGALLMVKRAGLTLARWTSQRPGESTLKNLDQAKQYGCKELLVIPLHLVYEKNRTPEAFRKAWREWVNCITPEIRNHDALIGYYIFDEPLWNGIPLEIVKSAYEELKAHDPYHPVFYCEAPRGLPDEWRPYAQYCDVFGIDIYPVPANSDHSGLDEKGMRSVGEYAKLADEAVQGRKPVWIIGQAFSWGVFNHRTEWSYPTAEEMRFMYFDAMMNGARCMGYFNLAIHVANFYDDWFRCVAEINAASPVFLEGRPLPASSSNQAVTIRLYDFREKKYAFAANRSENRQTSSLSLPEGKYHVLGEKRSVSAESGKIEEVFEPFSVHVYSESGDYPPAMKPLGPREEKILKDYFERITNTPRKLDSKAFWIWDANFSKDVCFTRIFDVGFFPKKAVLNLVADDGYIAYLNGKKISSGSNWRYMQTESVTEQLRRGRNILAIRAENNGGACGLLVDLRIESDSGEKLSVVSDRAWNVISGNIPPDWKEQGLKNGQPAKEIHPFGEGPWKF